MGQPEIGLRFRPLSTKTQPFTMPLPIRMTKDQMTSGWQKAKQTGIRVRSQHGALVCVVDQDDLEQTEATPIFS